MMTLKFPLVIFALALTAAGVQAETSESEAAAAEGAQPYADGPDSIPTVGPSKHAPMEVHEAKLDSGAQQAMILSSARAGQRIVAVGAHGIVLLSDDGGRTFRQARSVPADVLLTSVSFVSDREGWAVGHWGSVLHTLDAGDTWKIQRIDSTVDVPLFSVLFKNEQEGWATGLWSTLLETKDGGATWTKVNLERPKDGPKVEINLFQIFSDRDGRLYITAEQGYVLRSEDSGAHWQYVATGYNGSLWTGVATPSAILVAGLRGSIYRSVDSGKSWKQINDPFKSSITDLVSDADKVVAVALDGVVLSSTDGGSGFTGTQREDRLAFTSALLERDNKVLLFSKHGVVEQATP
jgi:photosystem II stability/assembly factor-like uncharacterized protein